MYLPVVLVHLGGVVHGAELGAAHGAERRLFVVGIGKRLVVHGAGGLGIERQRKLFVPIEGVARVADGVVAVLRARTVPRHVGGVRCNLVGDDAVLHIFFIRQPEVLLGRDVA